jgi:ribosomal protein S7
VTELLDEEEPPIYPPPPSLRNYQTTAQFGKPSFNDISYGPKPPSQFQPLSSSPKRKLDCIQLEEDDLSQFKRIRLVSTEKRKKIGPFLSYPVGGATFNAGQQQKRDEQTAWDGFHALQASMGNTHPDTLTYLHSFTRFLRNWGKYQTAEMIIRDALKSGESELLAHRPEVLQLMLSGLMTVLVDQQKLVEAEDLWNTSIETFRNKLGEDSANVLEKQFQQAHPFRPLSSVTWKGAIFDATGQSSVEPLSVVQNMSTFAPGKGFRNYQDLVIPKPERRDRG